MATEGEQTEPNGPKRQFISGIIVVSFLAGLGVGVYGIILAGVNLHAGRVDVALDFARFLTIGATLLLVGLTGLYARETRDMRLAEDERTKDARRQRTYNIRKAFKAEIGAIDNLDSYTDDYEPHQIARMRRVVPTALYKNSSEQLGMLTEDEVDHIIDYYGIAQMVEDFAYAHRMGDTDDEGLMSQVDKLAECQETVVNKLEQNLDGDLDS